MKSIGKAAALAVTLALCGCSGNGPEAEGQAPQAQASHAEAYQARLEGCASQIREICDFEPEVVLVLGTGLGGYVDGLDVKATIPYVDIEGWPESTAPEHADAGEAAPLRGLLHR